MALRGTILLLLLLAVGVFASSAHAGPERVQVALNIAEKTWGQVCQGQPVAVSRGAMPRLPDGRRALAYASWRYPEGQFDNRRSYFDCRVVYRRGHIDWPVFCTVMKHEIGHFAAWRAKPGDESRAHGILDRLHSRTRWRIMFWHYVKPTKGCKDKEPPPLTAPFLVPEPRRAPPTRSVTVWCLHGGGWTSGHPNGMEAQCADLRAHGIRAMSIPYPFESVTRAIRHLKRLAAANPGPEVLYGESAGATLALALAASGDVAGGIGIAGPTNFRTWNTPSAMERKYRLRMTYQEQIRASPYHRLNGRQTSQLIQCGEFDPLVDFVTQCTPYAKKARSGNQDTTLELMFAGHDQPLEYRVRARAWIKARWPTLTTPVAVATTHGYGHPNRTTPKHRSAAP